jgi:diguanylate cyclase (GGDEF)-like protein/excisionase family DNA binding protein
MFSSTMEEPRTATSPPEPWLRLAVTAELLGVSASTVRRWCDTDRLACFRTAGGQRRFRRADVDLLLNGAGRRGPRGSGETDGRGRRSRMRDRRSSDAERHNQMLTELLGLAGTITCRQDVSQFAQTVAERMKSLLGVCECAIFVGDGPRLFYAASVDAAGYDTISLATPVSLAEYPLCAGALERREVLVIASPDDPRLTDYERVQLLRQGLASELWIPLASRGHVVGAIDIHDDKPRDYAEILTLTTNVAQMVAGALETALLLDQVDQHAAELRGLAEMGELASQALDLDSFLVGVADQLLKATGAADCDVFTLDGDARLTCLVSRDRRAGNDAPVGEVLDVESYGPNTRAVRFKEIVVVAGRDDPLLTAADLVAYEKFGFESEVCVPLLSGEEVVGLVEIFDDRPRDFAESLDFLRRVGQLVGGSCDKARLLDRLDRTNRDLSERSRTLAGLLEATKAVSASVVLEEVLDQVARSAGQMLGSPECIIWEYDPVLDVLIERAVVCEDPAYAAGEAVPLRERPAEAALLFDGRTTIENISDPLLHPASRESMEACGEKTCLTVPLRFGAEPMGLLVAIETVAERRFTAAEVGALEALGKQAAVALHNARLYRRQEEHAHRLTALLEVGRAITAVGPPDELLPTIASGVAGALGAAECIIFDYDAAADALTPKALFQRTPTDYQNLGKSFPLAEALSERALLEGRLITVETLGDPGLCPEALASMETWGEKTCVNVPLYFGDEPLGILVLIETERERVFTAGELALLRGLSEQAAIALHNARQFESLRLRTLETELLNDIARAASASLNVPEIAEAVIDRVGGLIDFDRAGLLLGHDDGALHAAFTTENPSRLDHTTIAGIDRRFLAVLRRDRVVTLDLPRDLPLAPGHPVVEGLRSAVVVGLLDDRELLGALVLSRTGGDPFSPRDLRVLDGLSAHLSLAVKNAGLFDNVRRLHLGNLKALSSALSAKDHYTIGHSARVAAYAVLLAMELGWSRAAIQEIEEIAYLHDIGKIAVSDRILLKPGILTAEEWALMRQHPVISAEIVAPLLERDLVAGIRHHHERYDGNGYPDGLAGEAIPKTARLLCVVDSYDAMSSKRTYRPALSYEECLAELARCQGRQFDAEMTAAFARVLSRLGAATTVARAAAAAAAALIDPAEHALLRGITVPDQAGDGDGGASGANGDRAAAYASVRAVLRGVLAAYPQVGSLVTEAAIDEQRCLTVVDSDGDPETEVAPARIAFAEDQELDVLAGRAPLSTLILVDGGGMWVSGVAAIRDEGGKVVGLVSARMAPAEAMPLSRLRSDAAAAFAELTRSAAERFTRAEIDAMTDTLTGLYNHRRLQQELDDRVWTAVDRGGELSLLVYDIDRFRELNDRFGHAEGDEVLKRVADISSHAIRQTDLAARYGGDVFAIVLADTGRSRALEAAERLRTTIAGAELRPDGQPLTVSIGVVTLPYDGLTKEALLERADRAMYSAKRGGRDRCVSFSTADPEVAPKP